MSIIPEIRYDSAGNPIGVFLTMEQWAMLTQVTHPMLTEEQKDESMRRLKEYFAAPQSAINADKFFQDLAEEDNI